MTSNAIAYYNTVLFNATNGFDMNFMLDNEAFYKCFSQIGQEDPSINDLNELLAQAVASTFSNIRFGGSDNIDKLINQSNEKDLFWALKFVICIINHSIWKSNFTQSI